MAAELSHHHGMPPGVWEQFFEGAAAQALTWDSGPEGVWLIQGVTGAAKETLPPMPTRPPPRP